jgi:hypothetical protein
MATRLGIRSLKPHPIQLNDSLLRLLDFLEQDESDALASHVLRRGTMCRRVQSGWVVEKGAHGEDRSEATAETDQVEVASFRRKKANLLQGR